VIHLTQTIAVAMGTYATGYKVISCVARTGTLVEELIWGNSVV